MNIFYKSVIMFKSVSSKLVTGKSSNNRFITQYDEKFIKRLFLPYQKIDQSMISKMECIIENDILFKNNSLKVLIAKNNILFSKYDDKNHRVVNLKHMINNMYIKYKERIRPIIFFVFVSDIYNYKYPELPFFQIVKPVNIPGLLLPDNTFVGELLANKSYSWEEIKTIIINKSKTNKISKMYFKGANTGFVKKYDKNNKKYGLRDRMSKEKVDFLVVELNTANIPMYMFSKYKYLLNLPGNQPWSYRFKYLFLMKSLVINVNVVTKYVYENLQLDKFVNYYDLFFNAYTWTENSSNIYFLNFENIDYINIDYYYYRGSSKHALYENQDAIFIDKVNDINYKILIKRLTEIYTYFENNSDAYNLVVSNGFNKVCMINDYYASLFLLVDYYSKKYVV